MKSHPIRGILERVATGGAICLAGVVAFRRHGRETWRGGCDVASLGAERCCFANRREARGLVCCGQQASKVPRGGAEMARRAAEKPGFWRFARCLVRLLREAPKPCLLRGPPRHLRALRVEPCLLPPAAAFQGTSPAAHIPPRRRNASQDLKDTCGFMELPYPWTVVTCSVFVVPGWPNGTPAVTTTVAPCRGEALGLRHAAGPRHRLGHRVRIRRNHRMHAPDHRQPARGLERRGQADAPAPPAVRAPPAARWSPRR